MSTLNVYVLCDHIQCPPVNKYMIHRHLGVRFSFQKSYCPIRRRVLLRRAHLKFCSLMKFYGQKVVTTPEESLPSGCFS